MFGFIKIAAAVPALSVGNVSFNKEKIKDLKLEQFLSSYCIKSWFYIRKIFKVLKYYLYFLQFKEILYLHLKSYGF